MAAPLTRRRAGSAACVLLALAVAWLLRHTPVSTDISAFLPGPADRTQALLAAQLRDGVASRMLLVGIEAPAGGQAGIDAGGRAGLGPGSAPGSDPGPGAVRGGDGSVSSAAAGPALAALSQALARRLRADARFESVANGEAAALEPVRAVVAERRYALSDRVGPDAFTADGLHQALTRLADLLRSSLSPLVKPLAAQDPTMELLHLAERFADREQPAARHGAWLSADGRTALLAVQLRAPGHDIDAQQQALAALRGAFEAAADGWPAALARPRLLVAGPPAFAVESRAAIERDATRLSAMATAAIALLLWAALRRPALLPLAAVPVLIGAIAGFAAVALAWGGVHGITIGFGLTLIGEAVDYAIYVFLQRPAGRGDARLWRALWLAVLTSSVGFVAMILSGFEGLAQLGVFSVAGIVAAGAAARWLLPAWLPPGEAARARLPAQVGRALDAAGRAGPLLAGLALGAALLVASRGARLWNDELAALSPLPPQAGELDARLRGELGLPDLRVVIAVDGRDLDEALERAERAEPLLARLAAEGLLRGHDSPTAWVPSARTQAARRAALPEAGALRARLAQAAAGTPFEAQAFEPFLAAVERARHAPPVVPGDYAGTPIAPLLAAQVVAAEGRTTLLVTARGVSDPGILAARLRAGGLPGLVVVDLKDDLESLIGQYRRRALAASAAGMAAIVALLGWRLRAPRLALRVAAALACAVAITAGAVVLVEQRLTLFHLVALLLVVGVGSNYALFFATQPPEAAARAAVRASVLLCAASTLAAFSFLAMAAAPVLHIIGLTVAIGTLASLAAAAAIAAPRGPAAA